ncbi:MAG: carbohydrate-binding protein [Phycisphaerae bacterium]
MARMHRARRAAKTTQQLLEGLESRTLFSVAVGANIENVADYTPTQMFVDAMKSARGFGSPSAPWDVGSVPTDANGWPTQDAGACFITRPTQYSSSQQLADISGTYHFSATGKCDVSGVASNLSISNQVYNPATNTTTADVNVNPGATQVYLAFTGTTGGVKNIKLVRPGYAANTSQIFTNSFLNAIANVSTLRMMDYAQTNFNPVVNWGDRSQITDAIQTTNKGAAWEYAIILANQTHKDLWINVPEGATDAYVKNLALLFKNDLDPSLHVYVEFSNEVWNSGFSQFGANYDAAQQEVAANPSVLNYDGSNNVYYYAWRRVGERTVQISQDFASVYGQSAINTTVRPVLASQIGWSYVLRNQLEFINAEYGAPSQYIYAVAGAPYINIGGLSDSLTLTTDQVISGLENAIAANANVIQQYGAMAKNYGLKMDFYEGGVDLSGSNGFADAKVQANYDPRMAQVITDYLTNAYASNADLLMYYSLSSAYTPSGTWGLTENPGYLTGYKFGAFNAFTQGTLPALAVGTKLTTSGQTTIAGGSYISDMYENAGAGGDAQAWNAQTYDYLVNTAPDGQYTLNLTAGAATSVNVTVLVDGKPAGTLSIAGTGSQTTYTNTGSVSLGALSAGLHDIRLQLSSGGFGVHALNFTGTPSSTTTTGPTPPPTPPPTSTPVTTPALTVIPVSPSQLQLKWTNVTGETGYAIERSPNGSNNWKPVWATGANVTTFTNNGLSAGTRYFFRVRAILGPKRYSAYSNIASGTTALRKLSIAAKTTTTASGTLSELTWSPAVRSRGYVVQQQTASGTWTTVARVTAGTRKYFYHSNGHPMRVLAMSMTGMHLVSSTVIKV